MSPKEKPFFLISADEWIPWAKINTQEDGNVTLSGPMANILAILATLMYFDYKIIRPENQLWGGLDSSGNWTGMIGMLHRQEVVFAVGPFTVSVQRETACDFTDAIEDSSYVILQERPTLQKDMSGFLKPFSLEVWLWVSASTFCVCVTMFVVASTEGRIFKNSPADYLSKAFLWVLQTVTQESSEWLPRMDGGRLLVATWLLASLVFMSSYSGILTAMLTVPKAPAPIDSLEDLVSQEKIPWKMEKGFLLQYLKESEGEMQKSAYQRALGAFHGCWGIRQEVVDGNYAAICEKSTVKKVIDWDFSNTATCHLYKSRENVYGGGALSLAFQTKSPYLPEANKIINTLKEAGLVEKWLREQNTNYSQCSKSLSSGQAQAISPLDIEVLSGPFVFLVGGLSLAMMTFLCEIICTKIKESSKISKEESAGGTSISSNDVQTHTGNLISPT